MLRAIAILFLAGTAAYAQADAAKGKELFQTCAGCHNVNNDQRKMGPSLRSLFGRVTLHGGKHADDDNVRAIVLDGQNGMPPFRYSFRPGEIDDLMAYLHTLTARPAIADTSEGASYFKAYCSRCHKPDDKSDDLRGGFKPEWLQMIADGHKDAPPMKQWLDAPARQALADYLKSTYSASQ